MSEAKGCMVCGGKGAYSEFIKGFGLIVLCMADYSKYYLHCEKSIKCPECGGQFVPSETWQKTCFECYKQLKEEKRRWQN